MDLPEALRFSRYAVRMLSAHPADAEWLAGTVDAPLDWAWEAAALDAAAEGDDASALATALRALRRRVYLHAMARDLTGRADLAEVCAGMTTLADRAIGAAVSFHTRETIVRHGVPRGVDGSRQALVVVGMGKLGGRELNVSSDIDLVFLFGADGDSDGARSVSNREFFERVGRRVIGALHEPSGDGFVFRVDMRLRPYGESGPLAVPLSAFEQYLITQGRAWERYAWLKARAITSDGSRELDALVIPFVYRKYLDFDAYEGLRDVHRQIREQGRRRDYAANVKLGPGGIREIEFIVQALQLVRGGREPALRERNTLRALDALADRGLLSGPGAEALRSAYVFLRNLEHRLQYRDDQQTQTLPADPTEREALASAMGCGSSEAFDAALARHRQAVAEQFASVFGDPDETARSTNGSGEAHAGDVFERLWRDAIPRDAAEAALHEAGFGDPAGLLGLLERVRIGARYLRLPAASRDRFDALVPVSLAAASGARSDGADPESVFKRLLALLEAVSRRSAYLALLVEHPPLLPRLAQLMGASAWAADYLTRHPILLDELLDARALLAEPDWASWRREVARLVNEQRADAERQMDALRHFKHAQTFRLLAQDLAGRLSVERLADHLSMLADLIIAATLDETWRQLAGDDAPPPRFAVIGYGKLGGKELGYASDLDIVFLYDDARDDALELYTRLARRMILWLTSTTPAGPLYETDLRLRPDGAKGLVVSTFSAFWRYQREHAWTWEHQALTRARFVAGNADIGERFEQGRVDTLRLPRDRTSLAADIVAMRQRMHAGHPNASSAFDLKHDVGGMVDVEFVVQFLVLAHAHEHAELTRNAGNIALLGIAARLALIGEEEAEAVAAAYRHYRRRQHQLRLTGAPHARVEPADEQDHRRAVTALWTSVFGKPWR